MIKQNKTKQKRNAAWYLLKVKRDGQAFDPVCNFHVRNGAWIWRINWLGDLSPKGMSQSAGMMVNYRYILGDIEDNNQSYLTSGTIPASPIVSKLL